MDYIPTEGGTKIFMREYGFAHSPLCPYCSSKEIETLREEPDRLNWGSDNHVQAVCSACGAPFTLGYLVIPEYRSIPECSAIGFPCAMEYVGTKMRIIRNKKMHLYECPLCERYEWR